MRSSFTLLLLVALSACSSQASSNSGGAGGGGGSPPDDGGPVLVISDGNRGGGDSGMSVADALGHEATDDLVFVAGSLFVDADGGMLLCDAIAESFPPQCGGARITVQGLDLSTVPDLQEENGVQWAESVVLFGSVE